MLFKVTENVVLVSNSLNPDEMLSYSVYAYGSIVVIDGLRVKLTL